MIEMLIVAMILSGVTLKAAGNAAVDVAFAVRGKESPRLKNAKARSWTPRRPSGPAFRYFSQLWSDSWEQKLAKHNAKVAGGRPNKPRGAARVFWSGVGQDARRAGRRYWDQGWTRLDEKRRSRSTRVPDGTDVVPGEVVPEPPVPADPEPVPSAEPETGTEPNGSTDPADTPPPSQNRDPIKDCRNCLGDNRVDFGSLHHARDQYCVLSDRAPQPDQYRESPLGPVFERYLSRKYPAPEEDLARPTLPGEDPWTSQSDHHPTEEGTPTMTAMPTTAGDLASLDQIISWAEGSTTAHREQIVTLERAMAGLAAGDDTSATNGYFATAMEANATAKSAMEAALVELRKEKAIQEQYDAVQGAGTREFITGGR